MSILSAKEAARELGIDARTFRKFMREILAPEDQPGQGNRYHIDSKDIKKLKKKFEKWQRPRATRNGVGEPIVIPDDPDEEGGDGSDDGWTEGPDEDELAALELELGEADVP